MRKTVGAAALFLLVTIRLAFGSDNATIVERGNRFFREKKFDQALQMYQQALSVSPDDPALYYNLGTAQYKKGEYPAAAGSFERALSTQDKALEVKAQFNLGTAKYASAAELEDNDLAGAVSQLEAAVNSLQRAMELDEKDRDIKANFELARAKLAELKEKLKKQPQQQSNQQQKEQQGKEQEQQKKQDKQQDPGEGQQQQGAQKDTQEEMSPEQAEMLLEGFRQKERAFGTLDDQRRGRVEATTKDW